LPQANSGSRLSSSEAACWPTVVHVCPRQFVSRLAWRLFLQNALTDDDLTTDADREKETHPHCKGPSSRPDSETHPRQGWRTPGRVSLASSTRTDRA
jgi:hypothetical protein